ncbi:uncharacterized protein LACBIDRAFT_327934 [Laccaria bicolor S238N-H82]|uniref:Predicted protein n=1 Tax=Laccaria bicolor (strain S238N-H82 / ATCC MYA-4686) TaxID=486041 RepID=B0DD92_LACBS|nr:uncharacterized protein LACBIDRAFT_327934 [Laccaria bicolor S238N-H82]EDR07568.1 predicted protein [Laccaria bicolor S238N-H82]|eukprot:XP_001881960.1 predicted protein [Laccaria bicolor S238N-H82]
MAKKALVCGTLADEIVMGIPFSQKVPNFESPNRCRSACPPVWFARHLPPPNTVMSLFTFAPFRGIPGRDKTPYYMGPAGRPESYDVPLVMCLTGGPDAWYRPAGKFAVHPVLWQHKLRCTM